MGLFSSLFGRGGSSSSSSSSSSTTGGQAGDNSTVTVVTGGTVNQTTPEALKFAGQVATETADVIRENSANQLEALLAAQKQAGSISLSGIDSATALVEKALDLTQNAQKQASTASADLLQQSAARAAGETTSGQSNQTTFLVIGVAAVAILLLLSRK